MPCIRIEHLVESWLLPARPFARELLKMPSANISHVVMTRFWRMELNTQYCQTWHHRDQSTIFGILDDTAEAQIVF